MSALMTGASQMTFNPQNAASRARARYGRLLFGPPPPARAGEAVTTPPSRASGTPSAAITPARLMAITPVRATARWPGAGHFVQPQKSHGGRSRHCTDVPPVAGSVNDALTFCSNFFSRAI
jgi:hypothetical protein